MLHSMNKNKYIFCKLVLFLKFLGSKLIFVNCAYRRKCTIEKWHISGRGKIKRAVSRRALFALLARI